MNPRILTFFVLLVLPLASSANIIYEANFTGINAPTETTFSFSGGAPKVTWTDGFAYLGISGGGTPQIDYSQSLTITFARPVILQHIQFYRLFGGERALLTQGSDLYRLTAFDGGDQAHYSKNGSLLYTQSADMDGPPDAQYALTSMFTLENPFGDTFITSFSLTAARRSSFGLMSFNTMVGDPVPSAPLTPLSSVPDAPNTLTLIALAFGLMAITHNRRTVEAIVP